MSYSALFVQQIRSAKKKWVKVNTVKKNAKNKKKYTVKNKYKVKASGKKYLVYQYKYTYSVKATTTKRAYKFKLKSNKKYVLGVRAVNGKKYSAWKGVSRKTGAQKKTVKINGKNVTITMGKPCTIPTRKISGVTTEKTTFNFTPISVDGYTGNMDIKTGGMKGGYISETNRLLYWVANESFKYPNGSKNYYLENEGSNLWKARVYNSNVKIVWTLDGTEPKLGQADKTIKASEYPFTILPGPGVLLDDSFGWGYPVDKIKVRGTAVKGKGSDIFKESKADDMGRCTWIKVYNGTKLVEEVYLCCPAVKDSDYNYNNRYWE